MAELFHFYQQTMYTRNYASSERDKIFKTMSLDKQPHQKQAKIYIFCISWNRIRNHCPADNADDSRNRQLVLTEERDVETNVDGASIDFCDLTNLEKESNDGSISIEEKNVPAGDPEQDQDQCHFPVTIPLEAVQVNATAR